MTVNLLRRGWTQAEVLLLLHAHEPRAITITYADAVEYRSDRDDRWFLDYVGPDAAELAAERPEAVHRIQQLRTLIRQRKSTDGFTPGVKVVYLALLDRAERVGSLRVGMSRRDLNETTGLGSPTTVIRALAFLREEGLIRRAWNIPDRAHERPGGLDGPGRPPAVYDLQIPDGLTESTPTTPMLQGRASETFKNGAGYGQGARLMYYEVLWSGPIGIKDLADACGIGERTARKYLRLLQRLGLAQEHDGLWASTDLDPASVAPDEALERQHRMKERHKLDRQGYHFAIDAGA